ncbi:MAG: phage portal protein [Phycisphaerales bacterium]
MPDRLGVDGGIDGALLRLAIDEHERCVRPRLEKLWAYFRNPVEPVGAAGERLAQERGLPTRVTGRASCSGEDPGVFDDRVRGRREVVIENDIGWRVQTMIDFLLGRSVRVLSVAGDTSVRGEIERVADAVWEASGGLAMLQDAALLGHVYGHVDFAVRIDEAALIESVGEDPAGAAARAVRIEPIEPTRGVAVVSAGDYRELDAYAVHFERALNEVDTEAGRGARARRLFGRERARAAMGDGRAAARRRVGSVTEVFEPGRWRRYEDGSLAEERAVGLIAGVPVVHVQNMSQPFRYSGLGEVEPLIPLQDELNTRLSDRASRVTLQSFKMYLARGLDGFERMPVAPGMVWSTDNPEASIEAFGGDGASPSEDRHIDEIREAMDKVSAVPPLAGGVVRAKVGNLSSGNALRITLMGLLAKTARKRVTYGRGIERVTGMVLEALSNAGVLMTEEHERGVRVVWADPLPTEPRDEVEAAQAKVELGASRERVLAELGYGAADGGIE